MVGESSVVWEDLCGVPEPGTEWMLRDVTGIGQRELAVMANAGYVQMVGRQRTLGNSETRGVTQLNVWRTKQALWDDIRRYAPVGTDVYKAFASRPESDLYVVDLHIAESDVARGVALAAEKHDLDVQLVGLGRKAPHDYEGEWVQLEAALGFDSAHPLRVVPVGDVVALSGVPEYSLPDRWFWERTAGADQTLVDPTAEMVVTAIEQMLGAVAD